MDQQHAERSCVELKVEEASVDAKSVFSTSPPHTPFFSRVTAGLPRASLRVRVRTQGHTTHILPPPQMAGASGGGGLPGARSAMPRVTRVKNKQPAEQQVSVFVRRECWVLRRVACWRGARIPHTDGASRSLPPRRRRGRLTPPPCVACAWKSCVCAPERRDRHRLGCVLFAPPLSRPRSLPLLPNPPSPPPHRSPPNKSCAKPTPCVRPSTSPPPPPSRTKPSWRPTG